MTYQDSLDKIHSLLQFGSRPGLDRMEKLLNKMGNPQKDMKYIHIAGTNGKGSVSTMLSSILCEAGYKTGLFVSPYIIDFRERIQINNCFVKKEQIIKATEFAFPFVEEMAKEGDIITEFEFVNAIAFYIYKKEKCDVVVLETGMGGLLDCTNVIDAPLVSVITAIGLDHTSLLGDTIEKITMQKCGIIKENSCTVCSRQSDQSISLLVEKDALKKHNLFTDASKVKTKVIRYSLSGTFVKYKGKELCLHLLGTHQIDNLNTVLATIEVLIKEYLFDITLGDIDFGIHRAKNPARFELLCKHPLIILDGAHNPNGMESFKSSVESYIKTKDSILLTGMLADKDIKSSMKMISGLFKTVITVPVNNPRSMSERELADMIRDDFREVIPESTPLKGLEKAIAIAEKNSSPLFICGSLYLASNLRPYLLEKFG